MKVLNDIPDRNVRVAASTVVVAEGARAFLLVCCLTVDLKLW
jgi:hypothetical protein